MLMTAWLDGWRRVWRAPAIVAGVLALTLVLALPLALVMRGAIEGHLGRSLAAEQAADGVNYDWWQEFAAQATGLSATFTPAIIGFAATLDNISSVVDARGEILPVAAALATYIAGWMFLTGGILDRYARQRPTRTAGFFAASAVYFGRFLRLALVMGIFYWWMFAYVHTWLFDDLYAALTREMTAERDAFLVRAGMYAVFGALLLVANMVFDYAKIRAVVEDRRSMLGALSAGLRFVVRRPARTFGLYAINAVVFLALLALWSFVAPGAGGAGLSLWSGLLIAQLYIVARLLLKLHGLAAHTSLFQSNLAHAAYTTAPTPVWPESAAAETIAR